MGHRALARRSRGPPARVGRGVPDAPSGVSTPARTHACMHTRARARAHAHTTPDNQGYRSDRLRFQHGGRGDRGLPQRSIDTWLLRRRGLKYGAGACSSDILCVRCQGRTTLNTHSDLLDHLDRIAIWSPQMWFAFRSQHWMNDLPGVMIQAKNLLKP